MTNITKLRVPKDKFFKSSIMHIDEKYLSLMDKWSLCKSCKRRMICIPVVNIFEDYNLICNICETENKNDTH